MAPGIDATRRRLLRTVLSTSGLALVGGMVSPTRAAAQLLRTPRQMRGPFYPTQLPLDRDNDLVIVAGQSGIARGEIANVVGRVLTERGRPLPGTRVEIGQCDANGRYRHPGDRREVPLDPNFQGYGQFVTGPDGGYRFRTIKPVPYPGRAPHIHFAVSGPDFEPLITQLYVAGAPDNEWDGLLNGISDPAARQRLVVPFARETGPGASWRGSTSSWRRTAPLRPAEPGVHGAQAVAYQGGPPRRSSGPASRAGPHPSRTWTMPAAINA